MLPINSAAEYKELVSVAKKRGYTLSNCFFLPDVIREKTEKGVLFAQWITNGLLILEDAGTFYRCYYYLSKDADTEPVVLDKKAVIELPFASSMSDAQLLQEKRILSMGFSLGRESSQMVALPEEISRFSKTRRTVQAAFAKEQEAEACLELICAVFDVLYAFIPSLDELTKSIQEKCVWVVRDGDEPIAVLNSEQRKSFAGINHIAVAHTHRGMGIANILLSEYHSFYSDRVKGFCHWVDIHNEAAVQMYLAQGYHFGTRKANEYIKL